LCAFVKVLLVKTEMNILTGRSNLIIHKSPTQINQNTQGVASWTVRICFIHSIWVSSE